MLLSCAIFHTRLLESLPNVDLALEGKMNRGKNDFISYHGRDSEREDGYEMETAEHWGCKEHHNRSNRARSKLATVMYVVVL